MKKLLTMCAVIILCGGCSSLFKTTIAITEIRDSVMTEFGAHYRAGLISPETDAQIAKADEAYRISATTAAESLRLYKATGEGNPEQILLSVKNQVTVLINILGSYQNVVKLSNKLAKATEL